MSVRGEKERKRNLYALGWREGERDDWFCFNCKLPMLQTACDCEVCGGRCEWCLSAPESDGIVVER